MNTDQATNAEPVDLNPTPAQPVIDTTELVAKVRHYLKFNEIQWGRFSSLVLGVSQSRLSTLLGKPQPWHLMNKRMQMYYERMQLWMDTRATYGNNPYQKKDKARVADKKPRGAGGRRGRPRKSENVLHKKKPRSLFDLEENSRLQFSLKIALNCNNLRPGNNVEDTRKSKIENNNNDEILKKADVYEGKKDMKIHSIPDRNSLVFNDINVQVDPLEFDNGNTKVKIEPMESDEVDPNPNEVMTVKEEPPSEDEIDLEMELLEMETEYFKESPANEKDSKSVSEFTQVVTCDQKDKKDPADKSLFFYFLDKKHKEITKEGQVDKDMPKSAASTISYNLEMAKSVERVEKVMIEQKEDDGEKTEASRYDNDEAINYDKEYRHKGLPNQCEQLGSSSSRGIPCSIPQLKLETTSAAAPGKSRRGGDQNVRIKTRSVRDEDSLTAGSINHNKLNVKLPKIMHEKRKVAATSRPYMPKKRNSRCRSCAQCLADDCGECVFCLDKPKFGGPNTKKCACLHRRCAKLTKLSTSTGSKSKSVKLGASDNLSSLALDNIHSKIEGRSLTQPSNQLSSPGTSGNAPYFFYADRLDLDSAIVPKSVKK